MLPQKRKVELCTEKRAPVTDPLALSWLFYGRMGTGKTLTASQMGNPYFLCFERGADMQGFVGDLIENWSHAKAVAGMLIKEKEKHDHKAVVIDTLGSMVAMMTPWVCKEMGIKSLSEGPKGSGWIKLGEEIFLFLDILNKHFSLIATAHEDLREMEFANIKKSRWVPNVGKTMSDKGLPRFDFVGRFFVKANQKESRMDHCVSFRQSVNFEAKDRSPGSVLSKQPYIALPQDKQNWATIASYFEQENANG